MSYYTKRRSLSGNRAASSARIVLPYQIGKIIVKDLFHDDRYVFPEPIVPDRPGLGRPGGRLVDREIGDAFDGPAFDFVQPADTGARSASRLILFSRLYHKNRGKAKRKARSARNRYRFLLNFRNLWVDKCLPLCYRIDRQLYTKRRERNYEDHFVEHRMETDEQALG